MLHYPKLHSGISKIDSAWGAMISLLRRFVEHFPVTNGSGGELAWGSIVYVSADRAVSAAIATGQDTADWVGVTQKTAAAGEQVVMATGNITRIRMATGLVLTPNEPVYVDASTAGVGTNVAPVAPNYVAQLGWIYDASIYDDGTYNYADIILNRCCEPTEEPE